MSDKRRRQTAHEAARLVSRGRDIATARFRAARKIHGEWVPEEDLPAESEIRQALSPTSNPAGDRFDAIAACVGLLATLRSHPVHGHAVIGADTDGLEHALRVFTAVEQAYPYDEELLTAAVLLRAGLVIDRSDPMNALLSSLGDAITPRTAWLLESADIAESHIAGTIGQRARRRLESHPDFEQLLCLVEADRKAAHTGLPRASDLPSLDEAISTLRSLDEEE